MPSTATSSKYLIKSAANTWKSSLFPRVQSSSAASTRTSHSACIHIGLSACLEVLVGAASPIIAGYSFSANCFHLPFILPDADLEVPKSAIKWALSSSQGIRTGHFVILSTTFWDIFCSSHQVGGADTNQQRGLRHVGIEVLGRPAAGPGGPCAPAPAAPPFCKTSAARRNTDRGAPVDAMLTLQLLSRYSLEQSEKMQPFFQLSIGLFLRGNESFRRWQVYRGFPLGNGLAVMQMVHGVLICALICTLFVIGMLGFTRCGFERPYKRGHCPFCSLLD